MRTSSASWFPSSASLTFTSTGAGGGAEPILRKTASSNMGEKRPALGNPATSTLSPISTRVICSVRMEMPTLSSWINKRCPKRCKVTTPCTLTRWPVVPFGVNAIRLSMRRTDSVRGSGACSLIETSARRGTRSDTPSSWFLLLKIARHAPRASTLASTKPAGTGP